MSFYGDLQATAGAIIQQFGQPATLNKRTRGAYDPNTSKVTQNVTQYPIMVVDATTMETRKAEANTAAATVEQIIHLLVDASTLPARVTLASNDTITFGGLTYKVVDPGPVSPGGVNVVYQALVKA